MLFLIPLIKVLQLLVLLLLLLVIVAALAAAIVVAVAALQEIAEFGEKQYPDVVVAWTRMVHVRQVVVSTVWLANRFPGGDRYRELPFCARVTESSHRNAGHVEWPPVAHYYYYYQILVDFCMQ